MDEILSCLIEEANRFRGLSKIPGAEAFKDEYLHKAEMLEQAAEIVKQVAAIGPHGRLGDLDVLERMFADIEDAPYSGFDGIETFYSADDAARIIRLAPTIIPAEEGE